MNTTITLEQQQIAATIETHIRNLNALMERANSIGVLVAITPTTVDFKGQPNVRQLQMNCSIVLAKVDKRTDILTRAKERLSAKRPDAAAR